MTNIHPIKNNPSHTKTRKYNKIMKKSEEKRMRNSKKNKRKIEYV